MNVTDELASMVLRVNELSYKQFREIEELQATLKRKEADLEYLREKVRQLEAELERRKEPA